MNFWKHSASKFRPSSVLSSTLCHLSRDLLEAMTEAYHLESFHCPNSSLLFQNEAFHWSYIDLIMWRLASWALQRVWNCELYDSFGLHTSEHSLGELELFALFWCRVSSKSKIPSTHHFSFPHLLPRHPFVLLLTLNLWSWSPQFIWNCVSIFIVGAIYDSRVWT